MSRAIESPLIVNPAMPTRPTYAYAAYDRLTATSGGAVTHDRRGNLTTQPRGRYTYSLQNQLVRAETDAGPAVEFKFDPFGRRIEKSAGGTITRYLYDSADILAE